ncbi:MAG: adenylate/guanylate cyclase domain-containing protein [Alphaproteobacteria bacterium]|jgi:adenylate cyclase|nr:adenylate/guanylate cyclase domain-containing protein [Alphaproteobacteria bacterium]
MERRLAAILSADMVGFSRLMEADEVGTIERQKAYRTELIDPKIAERHGRIVKTTGDGLLVEFASVVDAVESALGIQQAMAEHEAATPEDRRIQYRVGINLGDIVIDGDDILGDGVNVAARLQEASPNGGLMLSGVAYESLGNLVDAEFEDGGRQQFKNITRPIQVWRWMSDATLPTAKPANADEPLQLPDKPSIAVLPFDNMSGDPEQEYFADGITEDIITALSRFRSFFVIARNSTFAYKGEAVNIAEVGRELGVRYVVEGSVRKASNRIRVTAQLIEAASDNHIWAERYDRDVIDIFDLQDEITETIVGAVEHEIGGIERIRAAHKRPENLEAWELFQRGMFHVLQMNRDGLETGVDLLQQSIGKDPSFAEAHAHLAFTYLHQVFLGTTDDTENALSKAATHTHEAIKHDDNSSLGHEMLARLLCFQHRHEEAIAAAKRAILFNPNSSSANFALGFAYFAADRCNEALEPTNRAIRLSPKDHRHYNHLMIKGCLLNETGQREEGIKLLREANSLPHRDYRAALALARYTSEAGLMEEAQRAATRVMEVMPDFTLRFFESNFGAFIHPDYVERFRPHISHLGFPE